MKRIIDLVMAIVCAPIAIVLCLIVGIIYITVERQSPFFMQRRVGLGEREFTIIKLQTMRPRTKSVGTHEVDKAAITKIGKVLRATKLDEIPQLWNVLVGDMSLVGPRPCLVSQEGVRSERRKRNVYTIRPGITGLSQVCGIDMAEPVLLAQTDAEYMQTRTLLLDLKIIAMTIFGRGFGDRVR